MTDEITHAVPFSYDGIRKATEASGFTMASDLKTGSLLKTLAASKPAGRFLELGTGTGLATSWILEGMDEASSLISIDHDANLLAIAAKHLENDQRLELVLTDGGAWISNNTEKKFDYIFADTWHGKYLMLDEALAMLNPGGFYIIDDMMAQANWPDGHHEKAEALISRLDKRDDLVLTNLVWATGIVIAVKTMKPG
jgi:predicted O-methyltransferase YrrM